MSFANAAKHHREWQALRRSQRQEERRERPSNPRHYTPDTVTPYVPPKPPLQEGQVECGTCGRVYRLVARGGVAWKCPVDGTPV